MSELNSQALEFPPSAIDPASADFKSSPSANSGPPTDISLPPPSIPGYRLIHPIGRGGMGVVYRAWDLSLERSVAIKILPTARSKDHEYRERFAREIKMLAGLEHPNILPVYGGGESDGHLYLITRYVNGGTLALHLTRFVGDTRRAVGLLAKVSRAVDFLIRNRVIHRDLKPSNILLGDDDEPLVGDFGLAKKTTESEDLTADGVIVGTQAYMAPELFFGGLAANERSEVWALGVMLFEMLTGQRPFAGEKARSAMPPNLRTLCPNLDPALEAIVLKCLQREPQDRYAGPAALADALQRWHTQSPLLTGLFVPEPPAPVEDASAKSTVSFKPIPSPRSTRTRTTTAVVTFGLLAGVGAVWSARPTPQVIPKENPLAEVVQFKSLKQRLEEGETVTLIGQNGLPSTWTTPVNMAGQMDKGAGGICQVDSSLVGLIELTREPLPDAFTIDGEVMLERGDERSFSGFYVGRREFSDPRGTFHALVAIGFTGPVANNADDEPQNKSFAGSWAYVFGPDGRDVSKTLLTNRHAFSFPTMIPTNEKRLGVGRPVVVWRPIQYWVTPDGVGANFWGTGPDITKTENAIPLIRNIISFTNSPAVPTISNVVEPETGVGLMTANGRTMFRNVRIVAGKPIGVP